MNGKLSVMTMLALLVLIVAAYGRPAMSTSNVTTAVVQSESAIPPLIAKLNLSAKQKKELEMLYQDRNKQVESIKQDSSLSPDARKAKTDQLNQTINLKLKEVLNYKQRKMLNELRRG